MTPAINRRIAVLFIADSVDRQFHRGTLCSLTIRPPADFDHAPTVGEDLFAPAWGRIMEAQRQGAITEAEADELFFHQLRRHEEEVRRFAEWCGRQDVTLVGRDEDRFDYDHRRRLAEWLKGRGVPLGEVH